MKHVIITGAYGKIGKEIAKGMAKLDCRLFLIGRDSGMLDQVSREIRSYRPDCICDPFTADLSSKQDIFQLASKIDVPVDVLINNAATAPRLRMETSEGIEMQWATNVLGYYWMFRAFSEHLLKSENPRVVNVASYWAGGLDLSDPEFKFRRYNNDQAYRQSKQADRQLTYGLAEVFKGKISINACHPGDANSKLSNDLGFGGSVSAKEAAKTPLILAATNAGLDNSGAYFEYGAPSRCRFGDDKDQIKHLLEICDAY